MRLPSHISRATIVGIGSSRLIVVLGAIGVVWGAALLVRLAPPPAVNAVGGALLSIAVLVNRRSARSGDVQARMSVLRPAKMPAWAAAIHLASILLVGAALLDRGAPLTTGVLLAVALALPLLVFAIQSTLLEYVAIALAVLAGGMAFAVGALRLEVVLAAGGVVTCAAGINLERKWSRLEEQAPEGKTAD